MQKAAGIGLMVLSLTYYWGFHAIRMTRALSRSMQTIDTVVSSQPNPVIEKVFVLPRLQHTSHLSNEGYTGDSMVARPEIRTLLIVGRHFMTLDRANASARLPRITLDGRRLDLERGPDPESRVAMLELTIPSSVLPRAASQAAELVVEREGKRSNAFHVTFEDIQRQAGKLEAPGPAILEAIPFEYPTFALNPEFMRVRLVVRGLPSLDDKSFMPSVSCAITVDERTEDCTAPLVRRTLRILDMRVSLDRPAHVAMLEMHSVASAPFEFSTVEFEREAMQRRDLLAHYRDSEKAGIDAKGVPGMIFFDGKNDSLTSLATNIALTCVAVIVFRPWRSTGAGRWLLTFFSPIGLQCLVGLALASLGLLGEGFDRLLGLGAVLATVSQAVVPLIEATIVALLCHVALTMVRETA